uniref:Uncharacterized protein n=1 Tax=Tanacetum cinerariifolium TaxID=118510 RepID=A0A6L2L4R1_TANCI|nr:hypothetical protein [Tanacetum cinerariifolium]
MAETMEQYMSKTRADYGSRVARPKIENKDNFELKGHFSRNYEVILFYNGLGIPTRQILNSRGAIPSKTVVDAKIAIQEMAEYSQKWHNGTSESRSTKTSDGLAAIQAQLNNLGREIKKVDEKVYNAQVGCLQCKGPHYTKDYPLKEEGKTLEVAYYTQFDGHFQGGGYKAAALGLYQRNNVNPSKEDLEVYLAILKRTREIKSSRFLLLLKLIHAWALTSMNWSSSTGMVAVEVAIGDGTVNGIMGDETG